MNNPRAFTLVELLLATALTTVLMIGVLTVIAHLGAPGGSEGRQPWEGPSGTQAIEAWVRLLREDLDLAVSIAEPQPNEVSVSGYGALEARDHERTHRPVSVLYTLEDGNGGPWVIRRQAALDGLTQENVRRDLVCRGVTQFELVKTSGGNEAGRTKGRRGWRLRVWTADRTEPAYDQVVTLLAEGRP